MEDIEFRREVEKNYRWNFAVNTLDLSFFMFAINIVSQATIMPLLVSQLTDSKLLIGLIPTTFSLGYLLPQLLMANYTEGLHRKLPFLKLASAVGERTPYLLIALVVWLLARPSPAFTLAAFFVLVAVSSATSGICTPAWYDMISKVIPVNRRGIWSGVSHSLGALMGIAGAWVAGVILATRVFPDNYALCFLLTSAALVVSWVGLALNREPLSLATKPRSSLSGYLKKLPELLRRDSNYIRFLIGRSISNLGGMAAGFFMVYGAEHFGLGGEQVGGLTAVLVASQAVMNLLLGLLADRKGHKIVLMITAFSMALSALVAWAAVSPAWLYVTFAFLGVSIAGDSVSGINIIVEFCTPENRPTYIGLTNTLLAPAKALGPVIGGLLATWAGYGGVFFLAILVSVAGGIFLAAWVREPRHNQQTGVLSAAE
jgi:MFS family permease